MTEVDRTREHLIETYRKKAKHYDVTSRFYPAPGYPQRTQRLRAVHALGLRPGDTVVDIACGTGLNFRLLEMAEQSKCAEFVQAVAHDAFGAGAAKHLGEQLFAASPARMRRHCIERRSMDDRQQTACGRFAPAP